MSTGPCPTSRGAGTVPRGRAWGPGGALRAAATIPYPITRERDPMEPEDECGAEFIDGAWTYCGCRDCNDRQDADREADFELYGVAL